MARKRPKKIPLSLLLASFVFATIILAALYYCSSAPQPKQPTVTIYLTKGDRLAAAERPLAKNDDRLGRAIAALLAGPTAAEKAGGLTTLIPGGTRVLHHRVKDGVAIVDFNRQLEDYGGGSARIEGIIAQIVYTATEVPGVKKVWVRIEGNKEVVLGGEGLVLDKPLGRADLRR
ncbi:MAG: GerMN domain-containing protein [Candidatus Margulisiibacteriota bacterium]